MSYQTIEENGDNFIVKLGCFARYNTTKRYKFYAISINIDDELIVVQKTYMATQCFSRERIYSTWYDDNGAESCNIYFNTWDEENTFYLDNFKYANGTVWRPTTVECAVYAW